MRTPKFEVTRQGENYSSLQVTYDADTGRPRFVRSGDKDYLAKIAQSYCAHANPVTDHCIDLLRDFKDQVRDCFVTRPRREGRRGGRRVFEVRLKDPDRCADVLTAFTASLGGLLRPDAAHLSVEMAATYLDTVIFRVKFSVRPTNTAEVREAIAQASIHENPAPLRRLIGKAIRSSPFPRVPWWERAWGWLLTQVAPRSDR